MQHDPLTPAPGTAVFRTSTADIWVGDDDIVRVFHRCIKVHDTAEAKENLASIPRDQQKKRPVFVDLRQVQSLSRGAREVYRDPALNSSTTAVALLVDSPLSRAIGNFFMGLSRMPVPTRLFTSASEALEWLKGFVR